MNFVLWGYILMKVPLMFESSGTKATISYYPSTQLSIWKIQKGKTIVPSGAMNSYTPTCVFLLFFVLSIENNIGLGLLSYYIN